MTRFLTLSIVLLVFALVLPGVASAASVYGDSYWAGGGEQNRLRVTQTQNFVYFRDDGAPVVARANCQQRGSQRARCPIPNERIRISVGDRNDSVDVDDPIEVQIRGGDGDDDLTGGGANDTIRGDDGVDELRGRDGNDTIDGRAGDDLLRGGNGDDRLRGRKGNDDLEGRAGNDTIRGDQGDDRAEGNDGDDNLRGGDGNDRLGGQNDSDVLKGGGGNDSQKGGRGADQLIGADGTDSLNCKTGADQSQPDLRDTLVLCELALLWNKTLTVDPDPALDGSSATFKAFCDGAAGCRGDLILTDAASGSNAGVELGQAAFDIPKRASSSEAAKEIRVPLDATAAATLRNGTLVQAYFRPAGYGEAGPGGFGYRTNMRGG